MGTAPTGKPHIGYLVPLLKIRDFVKSGFHVTILLANLHAMMDSNSSPELLIKRTSYYKFLIENILIKLGVDVKNVEFVIGSSFQLQPKYSMDLLNLSSIATFGEAKRASSEVVKRSKNPPLGALIYPIMQALDEEYLKADIQLGGIDQRKIFMFARTFLPKIGYRKRSYLMNPLIPGLTKSGKMSSSEPLSKIDFDDSDVIIIKKIKRAWSQDGIVEGNGLISMIKYILFELYPEGFTISRPEKWGGNVTYKTYAKLEENFINKDLSSVDIKNTISQLFIKWITPIREKIKNNGLLSEAYPI